MLDDLSSISLGKQILNAGEKNLTQIAYLSSASTLMSDDDQQEILDVSRKNNDANGITGILLSSHEKYLQLIEGETETVTALFEKIKQDPRHKHIEVLQFQHIKERAFPKWTMGYKKVSDTDFYHTFYNFCLDIGYAPDKRDPSGIPNNIAILLETYRSKVQNDLLNSFSEKRRKIIGKQILVVSDDEVSCATLTVLFNRNSLAFFETTEEAISYLDGIHEEPNLIFVDVVLPNSAGFELCSYLRRQPRFAETPIIMLSSDSNTFTEEHCFDMGASDYISKPLSEYSLVARVSHHLELQENRRLLQQQAQRMANERQAVEAIINHVRASLAPVNDAKFQYYLTPLDQTSGDIVLKATTPDGRDIFLLGDFTGHGLTAAVASPMVGSQFLAEVRNNSAAGNLLARLNHLLCEHLPTGHFMVANLVELNRNTGEMAVWNAAMPALRVFAHGNLHQSISSSLMPLGVDISQDFTQKTAMLKFDNNMSLAMYSDGLSECMRDNPAIDAEAELLNWLAMRNQQNNQQPLNLLMTVLFEKIGDNIKDDLTVVLIDS
ncbi:MAG: BLUF domain-containing protein [Methylophaga sp.]|nr:BLUF domain-containing protein [Methylophaga sp.]